MAKLLLEHKANVNVMTSNKLCETSLLSQAVLLNDPTAQMFKVLFSVPTGCSDHAHRTMSCKQLLENLDFFPQQNFLVHRINLGIWNVNSYFCRAVQYIFCNGLVYHHFYLTKYVCNT